MVKSWKDSVSQNKLPPRALATCETSEPFKPSRPMSSAAVQNEIGFIPLHSHGWPFPLKRAHNLQCNSAPGST